MIPNVCSEYSEQKIQAIGRPYWDIIQLIRFGSSFRFSFDLFSRMSTRKSLDAQHQGFFYARTCAKKCIGIKKPVAARALVLLLMLAGCESLYVDS